jgi:nucleotide-binding universal stress UspA family protein
MKAIKSILVPTDFSDVALNAYCYALRLADSLDASIDLLYVIPPVTSNPGYGTFVDTLNTRLQKEARTELSTFLAKGVSLTNDKLKHIPRVATFIKIGDLRYAISSHVDGQDNQVMVMGTAGRRDGWDDFLGTNTSTLINRAPCPVLVVPHDTDYHPIEAVCFATDLNDVSTLQAGQLLHALRPLQPKMYFLHVRTDQGKATSYDLDLLREVFDRPGTGQRASFDERQASDTVGAIFSYATENDCDLVVMHRPDRSWFHRLLVKSNTREAVLRAQLPLLIITADDLASSDEKIEEVDSVEQ